jgi:hypothetical protein
MAAPTTKAGPAYARAKRRLVPSPAGRIPGQPASSANNFLLNCHNIVIEKLSLGLDFSLNSPYNYTVADCQP